MIAVRYTLDNGDLLFAASGDELVRTLHGNIAALQADGFEEDKGQRWTVFATGPVRRVEGVENLGLVSPSWPLPPSTAMGEVVLFRLKPAILSGRWMETF